MGVARGGGLASPVMPEWVWLQLDEELKEVEVMAPYQIWLPVPPSWTNVSVTHIRIGRHVEAAELDWELDWVLDSFWKIFSTVLGYCAPHLAGGYPPPSPDKGGGIFYDLYNKFSDDILGLVAEQW